MKILLSLMLTAFLAACSSTPNARYLQADEVTAADYKTFTLEKIDAKGLNPDAMLVAGKAIKFALESRGMTYQKENAELLIEFGVGIKQVNEVQLKVVPIGGATYTAHTLQNNQYGTLIINISDALKTKPIWYMSGSRKIENMNRSQEEINQDFIGILSNFK